MAAPGGATDFGSISRGFEDSHLGVPYVVFFNFRSHYAVGVILYVSVVPGFIPLIVGVLA